MKLPSFKRLFSSDFPAAYKQLIDTLSSSLNNGVDLLYQALNNQISLRDNINCTVKDITLSVDANGTPSQNSTIKLNNTNKVEGCIVISALNQTSSAVYPSGAVFISFTQTSNTLNINNVNGLQAGQSYTLRIVAFQQ